MDGNVDTHYTVGTAQCMHALAQRRIDVYMMCMAAAIKTHSSVKHVSIYRTTYMYELYRTYSTYTAAMRRRHIVTSWFCPRGHQQNERGDGQSVSPSRHVFNKTP
jgi:hypothetical protein